jgi:ribonuclease M5
MTNKIKISEVIVVEGKADTANLMRHYDVKTYETQGSAISDDDLERLERLNDLYGVIVFTDPDHSGERIRRIIMTAIPTVKHAFLNRNEAKPKSKTKGHSLGVEHASFADLEKALHNVMSNFEDESEFDMSHSDLIRLGLIGRTDSRKRREFLGEQLRIGYSNAKQQLKRLSLFGLSLKEVTEVMTKYKN